MARNHRVTPRNMRKVMLAFLDFVEDISCNRQEDKKMVCEQFLNPMLDELLSMDFFGTEGQCDPKKRADLCLWEHR